MSNEKLLCELTAMFWRYYILEPTKEHFDEMFSYFSQQLVMIGTGKHEVYTNIQQVLEGLADNRVEAESIKFSVLDEWYECTTVTPEVYLIYGGIWVRQQEQKDNYALIEMDTRFSMLYRKHGDSYELVHIHHSMPYIEQQIGEHYPKTLSEKANDAMNLAKLFKKKSEMDLMTDVYNNVSFKHHAIHHIKASNDGTFYLFDLDHFKQVNDTYGHTIGDELLRTFSSLLKESFDTDAIVGRVGGDEFAVFDFSPCDKELIVDKITRMQEAFCDTTRKALSKDAFGFSVGIVSMTRDKSLYDDMFTNADHALYRAKQLGRRTFCWYGE